MLKSIYFLLLLNFSAFLLSAQTTDLSVITEAQNLSNNPVSQVTIYEEFQYVITILNSGNSTQNSTVSITFDESVIVNSFVSQNSIGGASDVSNFSLSPDNILIGTIADMPSNSSVEVFISVNAPTELGGIALSSTVSPSNEVSDINSSNNTSIISIDVIDAVIDFTVSHSQINPITGTPIESWGDTVTYQFTITNNSAIDFPVEGFSGNLSLVSDIDFGEPNLILISIECISTTNGTSCIDTSEVVFDNVAITSVQSVFSYNNQHVFTSEGSITFEVVYQYLEPNCGSEINPIAVDSFVEINLDHENISDNTSNLVSTQLIDGNLCPIVDACISTEQINPIPGSVLNYNETITFETTVCNNGPIDALLRFFLQNISIPPSWNVTSLNCISTTGDITCDDITLTIDGQLWKSGDFVMPANSTITIISEFEILEPSCSINNSNVEVNIRSEVNVLNINNIVDIIPENNLDSEILIFPSSEACPFADLTVTKTQIDPVGNPSPWGEVTYEIAVLNNSELDSFIELRDFMPSNQNEFVSGILRNVSCINTTGNANCFDILHSNIGVLLDGEIQNGEEDVFWQILPEDNWELPANSSVIFEVTVEWFPECSNQNIESTNGVEVNYINDIADTNPGNNRVFATTLFAPCIDLITQTYPEFNQIGVNQSFEWIIDISNSITSSEAIDVVFENTLNNAFSILETPSCNVITGDATCITGFSNSGNAISGVIPNMSPGSTVQIRIPVLAPSFGGAFNNIAEAIVSSANNQELTPETNLSISNVQIIAPVVTKVFEPELIISGQQSLLTFTITNLASNPEQNNIMFLDNLPTGLFLASVPFWDNQNNSTGDFIGNINDTALGVANLTIPEGSNSCSFSVWVSSNQIGDFTNNFSNFSEINNIDTSQANATLTVIEDPSDVDIEILKSVSETESNIGNEITFTITTTNLGTTVATSVTIIEQLPIGYQLVSSTTTSGVFNPELNTWLIDSLSPNDTETLQLTVIIVSSQNLLNIATLDSLDQPDINDDNNQDSAIIEITNCLQIPEGISPNNDNRNDLLIIPCIEDYPNNLLKIYNRYGTLIYQKSNYNNDWNGKSNTGLFNSSKLLPVGTYFYILEIASIEKPLNGYIYLSY